MAITVKVEWSTGPNVVAHYTGTETATFDDDDDDIDVYEVERQLLKSVARRMSDSAFDSAWQRLMRRYEAQGGVRFQFKDLRAKHAADFEDAGGDATRQFGHSSRAVTSRHYLRKARRVMPLKPRK